MSNNQPPSPRPANSAESMFWSSSAPSTTNPQASPYDASSDPSFAMRDLRWRWRYSWLFGIMYGPIPVGFLIALPIILASR